jgi:membrane glycosyltransferase
MLRFIRLRRVAYFGLVAVTTGLGTWMMVRTVGAQGFTVLEGVILALFVPTFAWIVLPFWTAIAGFLVRMARRDPVTLGRQPILERPPALESASRSVDPSRGGGAPIATETLTALAVPVFNEDPEAVAVRISAMVRSLQASGAAHGFHVHLLSDTQDAEIGRREEEAWVRLQGRHPEIPILYRRREQNLGRKAGNIGEFCRRCADDYDFVVVLDADSLMTGGTLMKLVATMELNPEVGLVQTVPLPVLQETLFGRMIQFAGCLYSPLLATGQSFWQGDAANYWGHNAIIRLRPFLEHAGLPVLSGRPPLGGEVLSHDFVEAAFLRRAGWKVVLDPTVGGSWEEVPGNVVDYARRDRRWSQGSLQHLRLLTQRGLHPLSRLHFVLGAMGYVSSLLWLLILLAGTAYVLVPRLHGPSLALVLGAPGIGVSLLAVTAVVLFLPKALGLVYGLVRERPRFGGGVRLLLSGVLETGFSVLLAPIMMLYHARFVTEVAMGRAVGWAPQQRDRGHLSWSESLRAAAAPTLLGFFWGGATLVLSPLFFLWLSPIFVGLLLSVPLLRVTSSARAGLLLKGLGLLLVPSETCSFPEVEAVRASRSGPAEADPPRVRGVLTAPLTVASAVSLPISRSMYNAERGLFDLRQGRPLLITDVRSSRKSDGPLGGVLITAVEGLDPTGLDRLRAMGSEPFHLVLTTHRVTSMGLSPADVQAVPSAHYSLTLGRGIGLDAIVELACGPGSEVFHSADALCPAASAEVAGLSLVRLGRLIPAIVAIPVWEPYGEELEGALARGELLRVDAEEVHEFVDSSEAGVTAISEAPVPLAGAIDSRFVLFRETHGLQEHVAILVGNESEWPDPVPVRLHSACLTGDLFGSLKCDCGEQLRGSMKLFASQGGGVLLYLAQEGRGIGLPNKFRAYTLQDGGLDTIDADSTLGFGPDERNYEVASGILDALGVKRIELLTNNPEKVQAMEEAGITVVSRRALHGTLNRHNLPYVRAKVQRAGHWLNDMLSQPLSGD